VTAAHALEHLPLTSEALATGALCLDKILELARFATAETERKLITWAKRVSAAAIRRRADRANRPSLQDTQDSEHARYLRWWWFDEGKRVGLEAEFPAAQGAAVTKALRRVADLLPELPPTRCAPTSTPPPRTCCSSAWPTPCSRWRPRRSARTATRTEPP
jgi:hypothetical protein